MSYFIYNNTDILLTINDVHYLSDVESSAFGSIGITKIFKIAPRSWGTTRGCNSDEVEKSISSGSLKRLSDAKHIKICEKEEYFDTIRKEATTKLETDMGIVGSSVETPQGFGFLNKATKKTSVDNSFDINKFIVSDTEESDYTDVEETQIQENTDTEDRINLLENKLSTLTDMMSQLTDLVVNGKPKKVSKTKSTSKKSSKKLTKKTLRTKK